MQENCNRDAERDRRGDVLGDACDPVPCPKASDPLVTEVLIEHHTSSCGGMDRLRRVRSRIDPDVLGSHNLINGLEMAQQHEITEFRFCQIDFPARTCTVSAGQRRDQDFKTTDLPSSEWRYVTLPAIGATGSFVTYDYPSDPAPLGWRTTKVGSCRSTGSSAKSFTTTFPIPTFCSSKRPSRTSARDGATRTCKG